MPKIEKIPVLIVDDRLENLTALVALLEDLDLDLVQARSGNEALVRTLKTDFALVLLDVQMPLMDGFETAELMRSSTRTRHLPIVFITAGMKDLNYQFKGYQSGAVDYLTKPIEPIILRRKVEVFCELYRQRRRIEQHKDTLERLVVERTQELAGANARLRSELSERKALEEKLLHSQKMEAVGLLAGGIAHDFNNILTVIVGYGTMMELSMAEADPNREKLAQVMDAAAKAANLTRSLLTFSRKQILDPRCVDLNEIVRQVEAFLVRIIGEDIQLKTLLEADTLSVFADCGQMEQVLINLATNARDAMATGGVLTIETSFQQLEAPIAPEHCFVQPGRYAMVSVSDTGPGMTEEIRTKIFEPFFTTKGVKQGSGLGLAIVYGIVKQHNGVINVYSEPGWGTIFRIYLPAVADGEHPKPDPADRVVPSGGTETILVAEDDPAVRKLVQSILNKFGYRVILAVDGQDAVDKFKAHRYEIGLILMDVIMPKKSGRDACHEIRLVEPEVLVLFCSGYTSDFIERRGELDEGVELILKPPQPLELLSKVREMLDRAPAPEGA